MSSFNSPAISSFQYSERGLALTKSFEGLHLTAYRDCAGVWTVGYGHTGPGVSEGQTISESEAERLLLSDLGDAITCINRKVSAEITQNQFDAMVDFCFNAGRGNFVQSTLLRKVNGGDFAGATAQFGLWVHAGGEVVPGLVRRRAAEAELFKSV